MRKDLLGSEADAETASLLLNGNVDRSASIGDGLDRVRLQSCHFLDAELPVTAAAVQAEQARLFVGKRYGLLEKG